MHGSSKPFAMFVLPKLQNLRVPLLQPACIMSRVSAAVSWVMFGACCSAFFGMLS